MKVWLSEDFDWGNKEGIMKAMADRFDMPSWALYRLKGRKELSRELLPYTSVFVYQLKACNLHCPYCYVDERLKDGIEDDSSRFFTIPEIVKAFLEERRRSPLPLNRIRPSGGEPTLVPEQWVELLRELEYQDLSKEVHVQSDTNLTTGHFMEELERSGEIERGLLESVASYRNFSLLTSFKGTDPQNYAENTGTSVKLAEKLLEEALFSFERYMDAGIDAYPFFYNPNPETLEEFIDRLSETCGRGIIRRIWIFPLRVYEVTRERLVKMAQEKGIEPETYVREQEEKWKKNFERAEEIMRRINPMYKRELRIGL